MNRLQDGSRGRRHTSMVGIGTQADNRSRAIVPRTSTLSLLRKRIGLVESFENEEYETQWYPLSDYVLKDHRMTSARVRETEFRPGIYLHIFFFQKNIYNLIYS